MQILKLGGKTLPFMKLRKFAMTLSTLLILASLVWKSRVLISDSSTAQTANTVLSFNRIIWTNISLFGGHFVFGKNLLFVTVNFD